LEIYSGSSLVASSSSTDIGDIDFVISPMHIGSGTIQLTGSAGKKFIPQQTLSGAIDEFRVWHTARTPNQLKKFAHRNVYSNNNLRLYFKFNEPTGSYTSNDIVLDSSGRSLHSQIENYKTSLRQTSSLTPLADNPIKLESTSNNPVLFPTFTDLINLNVKLMNDGRNYDRNNPNLITNLVPTHYFHEASFFEGFGDDSGNPGKRYSHHDSFPGGGKLTAPQLLSAFLFTWAKFFDEIKIFIDYFANVLRLDYNSDDSIPKNFLPFFARYYGFELPSTFQDATYEQFKLGEDIKSTPGLGSQSLHYVQDQIWRRLLLNLSHIIRSKGTLDSIESVIRSFGINPGSSLRIRQFGGARKMYLSESRENRTEVSTMLDFSGSIASVSNSESVNIQGIHSSRPFMISPFLSGGRVEAGTPQPAGAFVDKKKTVGGGLRHSIHGISNNAADGLFTSGSWTYEAFYKFIPGLKHPTSQSLMRLAVTGGFGAFHGTLLNLVAISGSRTDNITSSINLYARPGAHATKAKTLYMPLTGVNIFDGNKWHVTVGRKSSDELDLASSASYFIRAGRANRGVIAEHYTTSSLFTIGAGVSSDAFESLGSHNRSGSFICIGSQSITYDSSNNYYLNSKAQAPEDSRTTKFSGKIGHIRFWSKALTKTETREHIRNFKSVGVENPKKNFNFTKSTSGSFERLRLDISSDQPVTKSDALGEIKLIDFTQAKIQTGSNVQGHPYRKDLGSDTNATSIEYNKPLFYHMSGSGFEASTRIIKPETFNYRFISPRFDQAVNTNKVRIAGLQDESLAKMHGTAVGIKQQIEQFEQAKDDQRFSIDISNVQALDEDIMNIFATLDVIQSAIGNPELQFAGAYPDLDHLRKIYFNRLEEKINLKSFYEFFKWFDTMIGGIIEQIVPRQTKYLGINYVIESHALERHKVMYLGTDIYLDKKKLASMDNKVPDEEFKSSLKNF